jgi:hypothetical protein
VNYRLLKKKFRTFENFGNFQNKFLGQYINLQKQKCVEPK